MIYNPSSGKARSRRIELLHDASTVISNAGHQVEIMPTTAAGSAVEQAREAVRNGADIVFACGGDGTIHEVVQGLVSETKNPTAALGIIPLGSANALARHLRISLNPREAAAQLMRAKSVTIPVGKLIYENRIRYFVVMAGAGPDGALVYNLLRAQKSVLGRFAYYLHAARLFATQRFSTFEVAYTDAGSGTSKTESAISTMAVRVGSLGGLFSKLTDRQASVHRPHIDLLLIRPPAALSLPLWFASGWLNLHRMNPFLKFLSVTEFSCHPSTKASAHFQADGEWIGRIPVSASLVPNALRILVPC